MLRGSFLNFQCSILQEYTFPVGSISDTGKAQVKLNYQKHNILLVNGIFICFNIQIFRTNLWFLHMLVLLLLAVSWLDTFVFETYYWLLWKEEWRFFQILVVLLVLLSLLRHTYKSSHQRRSMKKDVFKISKNS